MNENNFIFIPLTIFSVLLGSIYANSELRLNVEIHVPYLQELSILNQQYFNELTSQDLYDGHSILENCIELEIKSNVGWSVIVFDEIINNNTEFLLSSNLSKFIKLSHSMTELENSIHPTSSTILSIDCKRIVNWENSHPKEWKVSPIFKLIPIE